MYSFVYTYSPIFTFGELKKKKKPFTSGRTLLLWLRLQICAYSSKSPNTFADCATHLQVILLQQQSHNRGCAIQQVKPESVCTLQNNWRKQVQLKVVVCWVHDEGENKHVDSRKSSLEANLFEEVFSLPATYFFHPKVLELTNLELARWAERNSEGMLVRGSGAEQRQSWWQQKSTEPR